MVTAKYPNCYQEYEKRSLKGQQEWALCHCKNLITRGNTSDNYNYTESMINIFKSVVLQLKRAYNFIELFKFITEDLQMTVFSKKIACPCIWKIFIWLPSVLVQQLLQSRFTLSNKLLLTVVNSPLHFFSKSLL